MPEAYFKVKLSVRPKKGGRAELLLPKVVQDKEYRFVIVKDSGGEGIIKLKASESVLTRIGKDKSCTRLTPKKMDDVKKGYPSPRIKHKYRSRAETRETDQIENVFEAFEVDEKGDRIIDIIQSVRVGFYIIDVKLL